MASETPKGIKRNASPSLDAARPPRGTNKKRDENGFRVRQQVLDKKTMTVFEQLGGSAGAERNSVIGETRTIQEDEAEGAQYTVEGPLQKVSPYFFTYLTYCKMRWRDRNILDVFVTEFRDREPRYYEKQIQEGYVTLNKKVATLDTIVRNGDLICCRSHRHEPAVTSRPIKIVHEDDDLIVIDKPSSIPVHPTGRFRYNTITKILQHKYGKIAHPCNRLDRLTSGLMFLGKNSKGTDRFVQQIKDRSVRKEYIARVKGCFPLREVTVDKPLITVSPKHGFNRIDEKNGKHAQTVFRRISYDPISDTTVVKCMPFTGRTHQIRVHLQYIGHPIANDPIYANTYVYDEDFGKGNTGSTEEILERLDRVGKTIPSTTWIHPHADGQINTDEKCDICEMELMSSPGPNDLELWLHAYKYEADDKSWSFNTEYPEWALTPQREFMKLAIEEAEKCGETQTQYNVGAVLVNNGAVISTGHSREIPGNTHAEQCALEKYFEKEGLRELPEGTELYTTMEPCSLRLSGNLPCVDRILNTCIKSVFVGVKEPATFVKDNTGYGKLSAQGVEYIHIPDYEEKILRISTKGHEKMEN